MRNLITICLLAAAIYFGWHYYEQLGNGAAAEARIAELQAQNESLKAALKAAYDGNRKGGTPSHPQASQSAPKPNWIDEINRKWQSPLTGGSSGQSAPNGSGGRGKGR
jgi:hypothetical protein